MAAGAVGPVLGAGGRRPAVYSPFWPAGGALRSCHGHAVQRRAAGALARLAGSLRGNCGGGLFPASALPDAPPKSRAGLGLAADPDPAGRRNAVLGSALCTASAR